MSKTIRSYLDKRIADLIYMQVPMFIRDQHPAFIDFLKAYYEFMESKLDKEIISPSDGITIKFRGSQAAGDVGTITIPNLSLSQLVEISSNIFEKDYLYTSSKFKQNRGPLNVVSKNTVSLAGEIKSILDNGFMTPILFIENHNLGEPGSTVDIMISDTVDYDGKYEATVIDYSHVILNTTFKNNNFGGSWSSNYIIITTDSNIVNEDLVPLYIDIEGFYPGYLFRLNDGGESYSQFVDQEIIWQPIDPFNPNPSMYSFLGQVIDANYNSEFYISKAYNISYSSLIGALSDGSTISSGTSTGRIISHSLSTIKMILLTGDISDFSTTTVITHPGGTFVSNGYSIVDSSFDTNFFVGEPIIQYSNDTISARGFILSIASDKLIVKVTNGVFKNNETITTSGGSGAIRYISMKYKNIIVTKQFGQPINNLSLFGITSAADFILDSNETYKKEGKDQTIVRSGTNQLNTIDTITIQDSPDFGGTRTSYKINDNYFSIDSGFSGFITSSISGNIITSPGCGNVAVVGSRIVITDSGSGSIPIGTIRKVVAVGSSDEITLDSSSGFNTGTEFSILWEASNNEGASYIDAATNQRILIYAIYDQYVKGFMTVRTINQFNDPVAHGLSKDDEFSIVNSKIYSIKYTSLVGTLVLGQTLTSGASTAMIKSFNSTKVAFEILTGDISDFSTTTVITHPGGTFVSGGIVTNYNKKFKVADILSPSEFLIYAEQETPEPIDAFYIIPNKYGPMIRKNNTYVGSIYGIKTIIKNTDIDKTLQDFIHHFNYHFIPSIPEGILADRRLLIKHAKDFYKSKGTEKSWRLIFRLLFNDDNVSFYYPSVDILKIDNGLWIEEKSILVNQISNPLEFGKDTDFDPIKVYPGKRIVGKTSKATGFVNDVRKIWNGAEFIYEIKFEKRSITGEFVPNEEIALSLTSQTDRCSVIPIFQDIEITNPGAGYSVNDVIQITTPFPNISLSAIINEVGPLGEVLNTKILNRSLGYPVFPTTPATNPVVTFPTKPNTATGVAIIGALINYEGRYLDEDGPDSLRCLRDDYYYQEYSYVVNTMGISMANFEGVAKKLLHPAGMKMFCNVILAARMKSGSVFPAAPNKNYNIEMNQYGGSIFGQPLKGETNVLTKTISFPKNLFSVNELLGQSLKVFQKPLQPEFSTFTIINNDESKIIVNGSIPSNHDTIIYGIPQYDTDGILRTTKTSGSLATTSLSNDTFLVDISHIVLRQSLAGNTVYTHEEIVYPSATLSVVSNTKNMITFSATIPDNCDRVIVNGIEYKGKKISDTTFKITNVLWSENSLTGKEIYANIYSSIEGNQGRFFSIVSNTEDSITFAEALNADFDTVELFQITKYEYVGDRGKTKLVFGPKNNQQKIKSLNNSLQPDYFQIGSVKKGYEINVDYVVKPYYATRDIHMIVGMNSKSLRQHIMNALTNNSHWVYYDHPETPVEYPLSTVDTIKEPIEITYSGSLSSSLVFTSTVPLPTDYLVGQIVYSYHSSDRRTGRQSMISSVVGFDVTVVGELFPSCDTIEIYPLPEYVVNKNRISILKFSGSGIGLTFDITDSINPYHMEQFVGKRVFCYNSTNKHIRHINIVESYSSATLNLSGGVPTGCDVIEIVYEEASSYWINHTNYQLDLFDQMININNRRINILPEPRHYRY